jgi:signal peptidase I
MDSGQHAEQTKSSPVSVILTIVIMVAVVVGLTALLRTFVFEPYQIPTGSMETTIMSGDTVFSEKISYYSRSPERGDIVTFADPEIAGRTLIKRVVATEGQTVDLRDGQVYVDGVALSEPYTGGKPSYELQTALSASISYPYTVPAGCVWVMGDNRTNSQDSRHFGAIPTSTVTGRAVAVYWPLDRIKVLQ